MQLFFLLVIVALGKFQFATIGRRRTGERDVDLREGRVRKGGARMRHGTMP